MSHRDLRQAVVALPAISGPQAIAGGATAVYARSRAPNEVLADEIDRLIAECDNVVSLLKIWA
jgi:hypothetical protein